MAEAVNAHDFDRLVEEMTAEVRVELGSDPDGSGLQLTGLEGVLVMLALKALVGAGSGFAGRAAYDKWKAARTRRRLRELGLALDDASEHDESVVDESTVRFDIVSQLVEEGVPIDQAGRIADHALDRMRARAAKGR